MLTLETLVRSAHGALRLARVDGGSHAVTGVWPATGAGSPPCGWEDVLAVASAGAVDPWCEDASQLVSALGRSRAAGLAVARADGDLLTAADRSGLPVLIAGPTMCSVHQLARLVASVGGASLKDLATRAAYLTWNVDSAQGVVDWLSQVTGSRVCLTEPYRQPDLTGLAVPAEHLAALGDGRVQVVATDVGAHSLRMYALGPNPPHVLVVARPARASWPAPVTEATALVSRVLDTWLEERGTDARAPYRAAVLQMLMSGQVPAAQRAAAPLSIASSVLAADEVRVYVVGGRSARRPALVSACRRDLGPSALVTACPVDDSQIIIVATPDDGHGERLRDLLRGYPGHAVGCSSAVPLEETARGHAQATRALAQVSGTPGGFASYTPDVDPVRLLNPAAARLWAAARLAPLGGAGGPGGRRDLRRADLLETLRLWLPFGRCGAARVLGLHRNTVGYRVDMAGNALGLDLNRLDARMTLDLALRIDSLVEAAPGAEPLAAVPLPEQLRAHLQVWAGDLLARMGDDATGDRLLGVVTTWIDRGLDVSAAAVELGVHDTTVRAALRKAESRLRSPLVSRPRSTGAPAESANGVNGVHDIALALHLTGRLGKPLAIG